MRISELKFVCQNDLYFSPHEEYVYWEWSESRFMRGRGQIVERPTRAEVLNYRLPGLDRAPSAPQTRKRAGVRPTAMRQPPYCSRVLSSSTGLAWGRRCICTATAPNERAVAAMSGHAEVYAQVNPYKNPSQGASLDATHFASATHKANMVMFEVPLRIKHEAEHPHPTLDYNEKLWPAARCVEFDAFTQRATARATATGHTPPSFISYKMFFLREWRAADERAALESHCSYSGPNKWISLHDAHRELRALDGY